MTTFDVLRERHSKGYASTSDEAWDRDPICAGDGHAWPCDTAEALDLVTEARAAAEKMRGDVHHHVNPIIGMLRYDFQNATGVDPFDVVNDESGLPDVADLPGPFVTAPSLIVSAVRHMRTATDAADAALGEKPMREQIADLHTQNANQNGPTS